MYLRVLFSLILINCVLLSNADHWGYLPEEDNGVVKGVEEWGGKCRNGSRQSPIDLAKDAAVMGRYPSLFFRNYENLLESAKIRNTGHSLQIDIPNDQEYLITGGGLPGIYKMDQMHFHWSSEHTLDSKRFGLELHIVSHNQRYANFSEAVQNKQGVSVLGVLFHISDEINPLLKNILDSAESVKDAAGQSNAIKAPFSPMQLLPKDRSSYFRYEGSLTTPSCDEAVIWTVLDKTVPFSITQIERFKQVKDAEGSLLTHNYRQLQRLNSRPLVYVRDDFIDGAGSSSEMQYFSLTTMISVLIFHSVTFYFI
ncbi:carbonic anhydrase-like [Contarinia nasturtii]|uniref:carbonic anhydrase-like n=1 Tax=Contarinia nasturtii TaxID=265458 RepID=UPI0012D41404|nr:carbonic anhydrase-like [Contarinia nasturtii]